MLRTMHLSQRPAAAACHDRSLQVNRYSDAGHADRMMSEMSNVNVREELQPAEGNPRAARPGNQTARPGPAQFVSKISRPGPIGPGRWAARPVQSSSLDPTPGTAFLGSLDALL